ncbi:MAG: Small ribosomal subunit biogenesis GTPase RsgA [Syntrophomonadaceae bacterium]|nr:Small ribosomal subunit biogenesis GTPase RsgA [Bacillota bacterium]
MLRGIIIRAVGGFYDVRAEDGTEYRCSARGRFKKDGTAIYVGDRACITPLFAQEGVLDAVELRETLFPRPQIANVEQVVIVCAPQKPQLSLQLLDRLLVLAENEQLRAIICMNKADLPHEEAEQSLRNLYENAGYLLFMTSAKFGQGIEELKQQLCGRISVLAGPSGVGKSSLLNSIQPGLKLRIGEISEKLKSGRHTTRQVELLALDCGGLVADTPGFNQLLLAAVSPQRLPLCFPEFFSFAPQCRFNPCRHRSEPDCAVKKAVASGKIAESRYKNYLVFLDEVLTQERRY